MKKDERNVAFLIKEISPKVKRKKPTRRPNPQKPKAFFPLAPPRVSSGALSAAATRRHPRKLHTIPRASQRSRHVAITRSRTESNREQSPRVEAAGAVKLHSPTQPTTKPHAPGVCAGLSPSRALTWPNSPACDTCPGVERNANQGVTRVPFSAEKNGISPRFPMHDFTYFVL